MDSSKFEIMKGGTKRFTVRHFYLEKYMQVIQVMLTHNNLLLFANIVAATKHTMRNEIDAKLSKELLCYLELEHHHRFSLLKLRKEANGIVLAQP